MALIINGIIFNLIIEKYIVIAGTLMLYRGNERMEWVKLRKRLKEDIYIYIFFYYNDYYKLTLLADN